MTRASSSTTTTTLAVIIAASLARSCYGGCDFCRTTGVTVPDAEFCKNLAAEVNSDFYQADDPYCESIKVYYEINCCPEQGPEAMTDMDMCTFCPGGITAGDNYELPMDETTGETFTCGEMAQAASMFPADDFLCEAAKITEMICCPTDDDFASGILETDPPTRPPAPPATRPPKVTPPPTPEPTVTVTAPPTPEPSDMTIVTDSLTTSSVTRSTNALDGYDFVGEGICKDAQENGYMQIQYVYTANRELCAEYCDRYRDIDEAEGKLRGFWWNDATNIGQPSDKHCYCQFEGGSDIEQLAKQFGGNEQIRLENFGSTATGTICSAEKRSYDAWCYRILEDTADSASCRSSAGEPTMKMTASPTISKAGSSSSKSGKASKSAKIAGKQGKSNLNTVQSNIQDMKYEVLNGAGAVGMYAVNFVSVAAAVLAVWSCSM
jgi:hypothetical protein